MKRQELITRGCCALLVKCGFAMERVGFLRATLSRRRVELNFLTVIWSQNGHAPTTQNMKKKRSSKATATEALLWDSSKSGSISGIKAALKQGAAVDAVDRDGASALVHASAAGQEESVRLLLSRGADVKLKTRGGNSALSFAAYNGHAAAVRLLLEAGADTKATMATPAGRIPVLVFAAGKCHREVVELFLKHGATLNIKNADVLPLNLAVNSGNVEMVKFLLSRGADVNGRQVLRQFTPIMEAYRSSDCMIRTLVDAGADVNMRDAIGMTVLMFATRGNHREAVVELLKAGADAAIEYTDPNGSRNSYDMAVECGHKALANLISRHMERPERQPSAPKG